MSGFDIAVIRGELQRAPLVSPWPFEVAVAVVNDVFRLGSEVQPPESLQWLDWATRRKLMEEQAGMLAHALASTSLRDASVAALAARRRDEAGVPQPAAAAIVAAFFDAVAPLTAEMIRSNDFRQEEFLRHWIAGLGGAVAGETPAQSRKRLEQLDYRKTLAEYEKADAARKKEAEKRAKALREAAEREAAARGWRE